jgi:hypothetical protein
LTAKKAKYEAFQIQKEISLKAFQNFGNGFVLLHLTGIENMTVKSESRIHTTPSLA